MIRSKGDHIFTLQIMDRKIMINAMYRLSS